MNVRDNVFHITAGHPQIVRKTLEILKDHFIRNDYKHFDMLHYLSSAKYYFALSDTTIAGSGNDE